MDMLRCDTPALAYNCRCRPVPLKPVFEQTVVRAVIGKTLVVAVQTVTKHMLMGEAYYIKSSVVRFLEVMPPEYAGHESLEWLGTYNHKTGNLTTMGGKCHNLTNIGDAVEMLRECLMLDTPLEDL